MAEAVAEVLARFAPRGVVIESRAIEEKMNDEDSPQGESFGMARGPLKVYGYLPGNAQLEERRQGLEEALWHLGQIRPLPTPEFRIIEEQNWMEAWKEHYQPIEVGRGLIVLPPWAEKPKGERTAIQIDPGMAFGTGTHPSTQLCLELLEDHLRPGEAMLDIGCGSGILGIGAAKLGASPVLGVDIDAKAIENAKENIVLNRVEMEVGVGSIAEVTRGKFGFREAAVVVTNLLAKKLVELLEGGLAELVSPGGELILSGMLEEGEDEVRAALVGERLVVRERQQMGEWVALVASR